MAKTTRQYDDDNDAAIRELEEAFGIDPKDDIDTKKLDGLLSDCTDPDENSMELVRSIRSGE